MKETTKKKLRWIYIVITVGILAAFGIFDPNFAGVFTVMKTLNVKYLWLAFAALLMYWFLDSVTLHIFTKIAYKRVPFLSSVKTCIVGQYYSAITPSSTGGQPMQVMYMKKDGIPVGTSTCVMLLKFVCYQGAYFIFVACALAIRGAYYYTNLNAMFWLSIIGATANTILVVGIFLMMINRSVVGKTLHWGIKILAKIKIVKNPTKLHQSAEDILDDMMTALSCVTQNFWHVALGFFITLLQLFSMFSVTLILYFAFGQSGAFLLDIIFLQALLTATVTLFPLPGASGASEFGFYGFMQMFFPSSIMFAVMLIWRLITYYSNIIVGAFFIIGGEIAALKKEQKNRG